MSFLYFCAKQAIRKIIPKMKIPNTKGIHKGEVTHHQDQLINPVSFKIKKTKNKGVVRL